MNVSTYWNHADGLTHQQHEQLMDALGPYADRVESAEMLAVGWLESKLPIETEQYRHVMRIAHQVIAEAFSNKVIIPGVHDQRRPWRWWMRQRGRRAGAWQVVSSLGEHPTEGRNA